MLTNRGAIRNTEPHRIVKVSGPAHAAPALPSRDRPDIAEGEWMSARIVAILGLIAVLASSACAASPSSGLSSADRGRADEAAPRAVAPAAPAAAPAPKQQAPGGGAAASAANQVADQTQQNLPSLDRMIIRTVTMTLAVGNVQEAFHKVEQLVGEQNGYLAGSQIRQDGDRMTA